MSELLAWWNLLFLAPLMISAVLLLFNALGLSDADAPEGAPDASADTHTGATVDSDHDFDQHDVDHSHHIEHSNGSSAKLFLEFLGAGKLPISLLIQIFFFSWGFSGWFLNKLLRPILQEPLVFIWFSIAGAFLFSGAATRLASRLIWKYAPLSESYVKAREDLIGCEGEAIYKVTLESGMAQVYDESGTLHRIYCRIEPSGSVIEEGNKILIVGYDNSEDFYLVKRSPLAISSLEQETVRARKRTEP